jgi:hypothetical protein
MPGEGGIRRNDRAFSYTIDTLKNFRSLSLSSTMSQQYLATVELLPKEKLLFGWASMLRHVN